VEVAETVELKSWIMSWGANAPVLEPESLRDEIQAEAMAMVDRHKVEREEKPLEARSYHLIPILKVQTRSCLHANHMTRE